MFHWGPGEMAEADIDSLLPLILYYPHWKSKQSAREQEPERQLYADQADWL